MTDRKKPGVAFWATVAVVVVLAYPLSIGPWIWFESRGMLPAWGQRCCLTIYAPIIWAGDHSKTVVDLYVWYTSLWRPSPLYVE